MFTRVRRACRRGCYEDATRRMLPWNLSFTNNTSDNSLTRHRRNSLHRVFLYDDAVERRPDRDGAPVVAGDVVVVGHGRSVDVGDPEQRRDARPCTHQTAHVDVELVDVRHRPVALDDRTVYATPTTCYTVELLCANSTGSICCGFVAQLVVQCTRIRNKSNQWSLSNLV